MKPMLWIQCLFLVLAMIRLVGCTNDAKKVPENPKPARTSKPVNAKWVKRPYFNGQTWDRVCNDSHKIIATARNGKQSESENWSVFGGNGAGYGEYMDVNSAIERAEQLPELLGDSNYVAGSALLTCP